MRILYKVTGESHDIAENGGLFETYDSAYESILEWEGWLGMSTEEALECEEVRIEEVEVHK